ncbi:permease [Isoptericola sp. b490]|uniref:FtsX-like permease family protein n=1 Tax=Actinotalea lenta TaxID=3064654 RepID=UPI0027142B00|nr:FtsX-like permease family protein [Isoptericola sp. b490]MDO8122563.1 permease [Isoptericola sp. b490]
MSATQPGTPPARVRDILAEAFASAIAQKTPTTLIAALVTAMCLTALLTVGRSAAAEAQVVARLDAAGARQLTVTDARSLDFLTPLAVTQVAHVSGVERAIGYGIAYDSVNAVIGNGGLKIPTWDITGDLHAVAHLDSGRWPRLGEALVTSAAQEDLGLTSPAGTLSSVANGTRRPVVGTYTPLAPYEMLSGALVATPDATAHTLDVVLDSPEQAQAGQNAVLAVLGRTDPADVEVTSPATLAEIRAQVRGDLADYGQSVLYLVMAAGGALVAVVVLADVLVRRSDLGRRRALGATRSDVIAIVVTRTLVAAAAGALLAAAAALAIAATTAVQVEPRFLAAVAVLAVLAAGAAAVPPAVLAANQDPVRVLRTA